MKWLKKSKDAYSCSACGKIVDEVMEIRDNFSSDYGVEPIGLCRTCLLKLCALKYSSNPPFETVVITDEGERKTSSNRDVSVPDWD